MRDTRNATEGLDTRLTQIIPFSRENRSLSQYPHIHLRNKASGSAPNGCLGGADTLT
jgi:hypothetical protein